MMGRYAPVARLGKGGMADVFLTLAHGLQGVNKLTVVKRLRNVDDVALTEMFLDEARLAARLNHPNIVHTYEVGEVRGEYFIAMEYLEGQPLSRLLRALEERCEGLREPLVAFMAIEVLKGLHYAHEFCDFDGTPLGVVHRDVSPHNLFVTYGGEVKLLDFGIAKAALNATHTEDGVLKGKIRYMSPEQATHGDIDRRADIYAFGIVFWEMLARRALFTGAPVAILTRVVGEEVPPIRGIRSDVSPALEAIALKALRLQREERYATAEEMRLDLEAYLRERKDTVSERELARALSDLFAGVRDDVRARIKAHLATMPAEKRTLPGSGITSTGKLPVLPSWSSAPSAPTWPAGTQPPEQPGRGKRKGRPRRASAFGALLLFLGAATAGVFVVESPGGRRSEAPAPTLATPLPVLASARVPSATATVPKEGASAPALEIAVPPPSALPPPVLSVTPPVGWIVLPVASAGAVIHHAPPHAHDRPAASASAAPVPSASASAPERPNIRVLDDTEAP